jgi:hypothetical protein
LIPIKRALFLYQRQFKGAILKLIDARKEEIEANKGFFKGTDESLEKITALRVLSRDISQLEDPTPSTLKSLIAAWNTEGKGRNINESRSRITTEEKRTTTRKMVDKIQDMLANNDGNNPLGKATKNAILKLINTRIKAIEANWGVFKSHDQDQAKVSALENLRNEITTTDFNVSKLNESLTKWNKSEVGGGVIDQSRSRINIGRTQHFKQEVTEEKKKTATQKMIDEIQDTLDDTPKPPKK